MELLPISERIEDNKQFTCLAECQDSIYMSVDFYKKAGFTPPWICYYASMEGTLVGSAAFKGAPVNNRVELAYGVFPEYRSKGIGAAICRQLVALGLATDPGIIITARTLPEENYSTRILSRNGFVLTGTVQDPDDGPVWEWEYRLL